MHQPSKKSAEGRTTARQAKRVPLGRIELFCDLRSTEEAKKYEAQRAYGSVDAQRNTKRLGTSCHSVKY